MRQKAEKRLRAATVRERFPPLRAQLEQEMWGQATWRASPDVPCRHSWRHVFAGITSTPVSPRVSRPVSDKKQTKSNEK